MNEYTVYVHIDPEGKRYYGATKMDVNRRWKRNGRGYIHNKYFTNAIKKFGWSNIQHIVVARGLSEDEAYWLEVKLIKEFDTTNPNKGYNISKGGKGWMGCKHSEDYKKKLSKANKGKHHTEDAKKKIGDANRGKNNFKAKSVICITTKRIFYTVTEGSKYYGIANSGVTRCCKGEQKSAGKLNGQKLVWKYLVWNHNKTYRIM